MFDSVRPHRRQPARLPRPWDLQARTLEWVAISFSNAGMWKVKVKTLSHVRLLAIPWTAAHQAPPSMGFSRQEYWSGVPLPSPNINTTGGIMINLFYSLIPLIPHICTTVCSLYSTRRKLNIKFRLWKGKKKKEWKSSIISTSNINRSSRVWNI